jgi:tetratricopeptide (TPR) repeat protein
MSNSDQAGGFPSPMGAGRSRVPFKYVPALGTGLKVLLAIVFAAFAILSASGFYLVVLRILEAVREQALTNAFTFWIYLIHIGVGLILGVPFVWFGAHHWITSRNRPNKVAIRLGILVFALGMGTLLTGVALVQIPGMFQLPTGLGRWIVYALHLLIPALAVWVYVGHRRAGPRIRWNWGGWIAGATAGFTALMALLHTQDPRQWNAEGPSSGSQYFFPSEARTASGNFIPSHVLMADEYCLKCHGDVYKDWLHSAHHFSSFNNPPYLFSVRETRKVALERDGNVQAARWCAGCHDPVPFFSGAFDDPKFDDVNHPTAHAGITCTTCHAITHVNSTVGNASYTIEEPLHYPFAFSDNPILQWVNNALVRAKPDFHKKTFLKPIHQTAEFCSTCHKVSLPLALNHYQEFTRGQNHYDSFLLSGVSGHNARSFYYPETAKENCAACHMPLKASNDFGAKDFDGNGERKVHNHLFVGANTGLPEIVAREKRYEGRAAELKAVADKQAEHLKNKKLRIDLFALKRGNAIDGELLGPIRPTLPELEPGREYLVEVVIRTLAVGHAFSQGTIDSNEIWVEFTAATGGKVFASNGGMQRPGDAGVVDERAHFINALVLDRSGNRIDRRNPQDIFTPLYDKQIPPGAASVVHYKLKVPEDAKGPVELKAKVRYRKFDQKYLEYMYPGGEIPVLRVVDMCEDMVSLPVKGGAAVVAQESSIKPAWQRWNDYGIGCLLEGGANAKRGELRQAEQAFEKVAAMGGDASGHGWLNQARVLIAEGRLDKAAEALQKARTAEPPAPWWTLAWFTGLAAAETAADAQGFDQAIKAFRSIVDPANQPKERGFDFGRDYVVWNRLALTLFQRAQLETAGSEKQIYFLTESAKAYLRVLAEDSEDQEAHYGISQALNDLAGGWARPVVVPGPDEACMTGDELIAMAQDAAKAGEFVRREESLRLMAHGIAGWAAQSPQPSTPRWSPLRRALKPLDEALGKALESGADPKTREAMAGILAQGHRLAHTLLKPDDLARAKTTTAFRAKHAAANAAAEAIILYPTTGEPTWNKP